MTVFELAETEKVLVVAEMPLVGTSFAPESQRDAGLVDSDSLDRSGSVS